MNRKRVIKRSRHTLAQNLLFDFVVKAGHTCFRCGKKLRRKDFTIEHKSPWLGAPDYLELYYDLGNIAYSHASCNFGAARKVRKIYNSKDEERVARLARKRKAWKKLSKSERQQNRRLRYEKYGQ